jgi:hypothetical protein
LTLVNKNFEIVPASFGEDLSAHGGLKSVAFCGFGPEAFGIKFDLMASLVDIPAEEGWIKGGITCIEALRCIYHVLFVVFFLLVVAHGHYYKWLFDNCHDMDQVDIDGVSLEQMQYLLTWRVCSTLSKCCYSTN